MNLLEETKEGIKSSGHKIKDIIFIGSEESGHSCTWEEYKKLANIEYDSGFGGAEIATDLIIVFSDGFKMERGEYDGSEWWQYTTPFKKPTMTDSIATLKGGLWEKFEALNGSSPSKADPTEGE